MQKMSYIVYIEKRKKKYFMAAIMIKCRRPSSLINNGSVKKGQGKNCGNEARKGIKRRKRGDRRKGVTEREMEEGNMSFTALFSRSFHFLSTS